MTIALHLVANCGALTGVPLLALVGIELVALAVWLVRRRRA